MPGSDYERWVSHDIIISDDQTFCGFFYSEMPGQLSQGYCETMIMTEVHVAKWLRTQTLESE